VDVFSHVHIWLNRPKEYAGIRSATIIPQRGISPGNINTNFFRGVGQKRNQYDVM
jgi:hypothetical protein